MEFPRREVRRRPTPARCATTSGSASAAKNAPFDPFAFQQVCKTAECVERLRAVSADAARDAFAQMIEAGVSVAVTNGATRGTTQRIDAARAA
jgi:hypothetical protein